jgi:hypothetical protein
MTRKEGGGHARKIRKTDVNMGFDWANVDKRDGFAKLGVGGRIILQLTFMKQDGESERDSCGSG